MGKTHELRLSLQIAAPREAVWERVSDHENIPSWGPPDRVKIVEAGAPERGGLGAVRAVKFPRAPEVLERVTKFEAGRCYEYGIFRGFPGLEHHLGRILVRDGEAGGSELRWEIDFRFKGWQPFGWFGGWWVKRLGVTMLGGMEELKRQLESGTRSRVGQTPH